MKKNNKFKFKSLYYTGLSIYAVVAFFAIVLVVSIVIFSYNKIEEKNIIDLDIIKKLETEYLIHYINLGYVKINKHKTGSLGGGNIPYFTKEYCLDIAKTCKTKTEFKKYHSVYNYSKKYNWLDDMYSHMEIIKQPNGYWNDKQRCSDIAKTCKTKTEFKKYYTAYLYSKKNNWLDEICSHMEIIKHPNGYWNNKEICFEESLNYKNKQEFKTYRRSAYNYSYTNGWLNEFFPK